MSEETFMEIKRQADMGAEAVRKLCDPKLNIGADDMPPDTVGNISIFCQWQVASEMQVEEKTQVVAASILAAYLYGQADEIRRAIVLGNSTPAKS